MQKAADKYIPNIKIPQNISDLFKPKPYWSSELSKAIAERRLALANLRGCPSSRNLDILKEKISTAQRLIRRARCNSFQQFCTSVDETTSASEMWRKMRWLKGRLVPNTSVDKEKAERLLKDLTPDFVCPPRPSFKSNNTVLESPIVMPELINCIKTTDTAPGSDQISFSMIKHLPPTGKQMLLQIYNQCLSLGFVPQQWRQIKVVPIPKHSSASSLRPISLISCICKIFHSILAKRIEWFFEKQCLLPEDMVGFRKSRSCLDNLSRLVSGIQLGFSKNWVTAACFIDIESAYNNVDIPCLVHILDRFGVGSKVCIYLWSFLSNRHLQVATHDCEVVRSTSRGLAQGDPLAPLLFNILTLHICHNVTQVSISQYADDFVLYSTKNNLDLAFEELRSALRYTIMLIDKLGLTMSPNKTKICVFKKGCFRRSINFCLDGMSIEVVNNIKYLGLWLDSSLRWGKHINETSQKVIKFINLLKVLSGPGWGVHQKHIRRLYISIIRSRIDYASFLYDNSCNSKLIKLDRIQNQALRVIGGFIRSTPIHVMESELCLPPLYIRRKYLASKFILKSKSFLNNKTIQLLEKLSQFTDSIYWRNKKLPLLIDILSQYNSISIHSSAQLGMFSLDKWISSIDLSHIIIDKIPSISKAKRHYNIVQLK
uniref:Reverse transcriptase domain-containing protein n=1 Tax=Heliothis virescens TaxID=7102 RepID=A0A2A4JIU8_HELVI